MVDDIIKQCNGFDWDDGNLTKNARKHDVMPEECEQVFRNAPQFFMPDSRHSQSEERFYVFGYTDEERLLSVAFTVRGKKIRIIMARPMSRKERNWYYEQIEET